MREGSAEAPARMSGSGDLFFRSRSTCAFTFSISQATVGRLCDPAEVLERDQDHVPAADLVRNGGVETTNARTANGGRQLLDPMQGGLKRERPAHFDPRPVFEMPDPASHFGGEPQALSDKGWEAMPISSLNDP